MTPLSDFHTHCCFSSDSKTAPEQMIKQAIASGLSGICFTDHNDFDYPPENGETVFALPFDEYFQTLTQLRDLYKGTILVYIGVEQGLSVPAADRINHYDPNNLLDFIIGSSHLVDGNDPYYPSFWEDRSASHAISAYFESILENLKVCTNFDVYGHLDYIIRYAPQKDTDFNWESYRDIIDMILRLLIAQGKGIEINTSGLRSGLKYPNPCLGILKRFRELGGEIVTIGSDAHSPAHLAHAFDMLSGYLESAGFHYYTIFRHRTPEFIKL